MNTETSPENIAKLETVISKATAEQIDILWAILKYKEIGIYRKIKCMCAALGANVDDLSNILPKDQEGRILDYKSRHMIHDVLIKYS
jgi:hypothetical protein